MWPYWLMFLVPAALAVQEASRSYAVLGAGARRPSLPTSWWLVLAAFTLMLGWRHEVGGDWGNYLRNFAAAFYDSQYADWWWNDPGYRLLEWLSLRLDWDIYGVNLMAAALFSYGLVVFCRHLPRPWLALAVAVPYLVIILGMGYSRQGAALGAIMVGLVSLGHGKVMRFVLWTLLGATMHKSGVLLLPLAALAASRNRWLAAAWVGVVVASAYALLLQDSVEALRVGYLEAEYQSQGALIRLVMNTLPALVLLARRRRFEVTIPQARLWFWMSVSALALLAAYYFSPSSTAVDRVGLYLLPLQLMVFSYLPEVMGSKSGRGNQAWVFAALAYYAAVEFVWLNFAAHSQYWIPYQWYPLT